MNKRKQIGNVCLEPSVSTIPSVINEPSITIPTVNKSSDSEDKRKKKECNCASSKEWKDGISIDCSIHTQNDYKTSKNEAKSSLLSKGNATTPSPKEMSWEEGKYFEFKSIEDRDKWIIWMKTDLIPHIEAHQLAEIKEKIRGMKKELECCEECDEVTISTPYVWNKAIDRILQILEEK